MKRCTVVDDAIFFPLRLWMNFYMFYIGRFRATTREHDRKSFGKSNLTGCQVDVICAQIVRRIL